MTSPTHSNYLPVRQDWLDRRREPALDPELPIVDAHHHLWDRPGWRYLLDEFLADIKASGHNIVATVFMQCQAMYRASGDAALRPWAKPNSSTALPRRQQVGLTVRRASVRALLATRIFGSGPRWRRCSKLTFGPAAVASAAFATSSSGMRTGV